MRQTLIIFIVISFVTSCSDRTRQIDKGQVIAPVMNSVISEFQDSVGEPKFEPDTTIGKISLVNYKNVDEYLGDDVMDRLSYDDIPNTSVISYDKKQQLTVYFHPVGNNKEFYEFQVNYIDKGNNKIRVSSDTEFITESKIKLGISIEDFKAIKGAPDSISNYGMTIFHYRIADFENSKFLKKYNMPSYYGVYKFKNGYLTEFRFGFEYQ